MSQIDEQQLRVLQFHWIAYNREAICLGQPDKVSKTMIAGAWLVSNNRSTHVRHWRARNRLEEDPPRYGFWAYYKPARPFDPNNYNPNDPELRLRIDTDVTGSPPNGCLKQYPFSQLSTVWSRFINLISSEQAKLPKGQEEYVIARCQPMEKDLPLADIEEPESPIDQNLQELLLKKNQIILYGPPGTGKTYSTKDIAVKFIGG